MSKTEPECDGPCPMEYSPNDDVYICRRCGFEKRYRKKQAWWETCAKRLAAVIFLPIWLLAGLWLGLVQAYDGFIEDWRS